MAVVWVVWCGGGGVVCFVVLHCVGLRCVVCAWCDVDTGLPHVRSVVLVACNYPIGMATSRRACSRSSVSGVAAGRSRVGKGNSGMTSVSFSWS